MKAPDKLYLGRRSYGPLIGGWQTNPFESKEIESIAYIRKDALLEWAEEKIAKGTIDEWDKGYVQCLKDLIDKLNSL